MSDQKKYTSKLSGSRVLVIGGSSGIGFAVAEACTEYGALVTISSSNKDRVVKAVERLKSSYPSAKDRVFGVTVNLSNADTLETELKNMLDNTMKEIGGEKLDHVIFTAGDKLAVGKIEDMNMQSILAAGQIRFFAPLLLAKFLSTYLHSSHTSSYTITTGSIYENPIPNWSVIASFAGGHYSMVRNLALDLKPIRVNGVAPGVVDTEMWDVYGQEGKEKTLKGMGEKMATGRPGRPEDVAETFLGILRDGNIDGSMVSTNGGSSIMG